MRSWIIRLADRCGAAVQSFRGWRWQYRALAAMAAGLILLPASQVWYVGLGGNFHTVVAGDVYRSGQPSGHRLRQLARSCGLRTVVNLRGETEDDWYFEEHKIGRELGIRVVDVGLWASEAPETDQLRLLVDTLADAPGAVLVHCNSGGDRSGLAAALALLLRTDATIAGARQQLSLYYGHNPFGRAACQDAVLDQYESWLAKKGWEHSTAHLRLWAQTAYSH
jgi:protein tyrosine/serine phosphatase